ncbi:MAG: AI-2E family transporter [Deinococcota bacterium]
MRETFRQAWQYLWVRVAVYTLLIVLVLYYLNWALAMARSAIVTVLIAVVFSYITSPIVRWFERRRLSRALGVVVVFVGFLLFVALASVLLANMAGQLAGFLTGLPNLVSPLLDWAQALPGRFGQIELPQPVRDALAQASSSIQTLLQGFTQSLLRLLQALLAQGGNLIGFFSNLVGGIFQLLTALTISIYLLYDLPKIAHTLLKAIPEPYQPMALEVSQKADRAFGSFVRGQVLVATISGTIVAVGLSIVGVPQAASLGFLTFIFNFIPFVGVIISAIPAILLALPLGWLKLALTVGVLYLTNQLEGNVYGPFVMRRAVSIHPVTGIIGILVASSLFGFIGALFSTPMLAFFKILYVDYYQKSRFYREG